MLWCIAIAVAQDAPGPVEPVPPVEPAPDEPADPVPVSGKPSPMANPGDPPPPRDDSPFKFGVGAYFNAGGAFMAQPKDRTAPGFAGELPYSGMAGFSPGAGARIDMRFMDIVGIEAQLIRSWDQAESKYTINGTDVGFAIKQPAWHVPLHLHLGIPHDVMHVYAFGGVELVVPLDTTVPSPAGLPWTMSGSATTWHMWSFGFGFEGRLPIDGLDLRLPLQFRGAASAPYSGVALERATYDISQDGLLSSMHYDMRWQYYASINLGLTWFFPN